MKKICVITGTRAEYGLLYWLMRGIQNHPEFNLQIIATGMHLSPEFGFTYKEIVDDGFVIDKNIQMNLSSDSTSGITKSIGVGLLGFAQALDELSPDLVLLLGDRYEILAAAIAALIGQIPIGHIHGGETTEGAFDEAIRHSISKMAWWHFVAADEYKKRVIQLGEDPSRVFEVGGLGVDSIVKTKLLSKKELVLQTGIQFGDRNLLITYHPVTLDNGTSLEQFKPLLSALDDLDDVYLIFTMPNSDPDNKAIKAMIDSFVSKHPEKSISFVTLGRLKYLSLLQYVDGVVGNSSSGLLEAPSFKIGTVNIGDRQAGRLKAKSVIDCSPDKESISRAINKVFSERLKNMLSSVKNPYGDGNASTKIIEILQDEKFPKEVKKKFYNL